MTFIPAKPRWAQPPDAPKQSDRSAQLEAAWDRIQTFAALPPDWAGQGSIPVNASTVALAREVLSSIPAHVFAPHVAPSGDGEVVFTWVAGADRIEAALDGDGHLSWASRIGGNVAPGGDIAMHTNDLSPFQVALASLFA